MKRKLLIFLFFILVVSSGLQGQTFRTIRGWSADINEHLESFLNSTIPMTIRKVAVFDCDGTTFGQVPFYLADEALYQYADEVLRPRKDENSLAKLKILDKMVKNGDNVGKEYVEDRVHFLSGLTAEEIEMIGYNCYRKSYRGKFYPEMKELIANLKEYGFEVWIITASPELLYQKFVAEELGLSNYNVIGVKSVIKGGRATDEIILPIPQDDGKAHAIETFIKVRPLLVGGNSRGDMDMINESVGLKMIVNPDDVTVRGSEDGPMSGHTVKSYWAQQGALIVKCNDVADPLVRFSTANWKIKKNLSNPK